MLWLWARETGTTSMRPLLKIKEHCLLKTSPWISLDQYKRIISYGDKTTKWIKWNCPSHCQSVSWRTTLNYFLYIHYLTSTHARCRKFALVSFSKQESKSYLKNTNKNKLQRISNNQQSTTHVLGLPKILFS